MLDIAPYEKSAIWIGIFYAGIPLGVAFGFLFRTLLSAAFEGWY